MSLDKLVALCKGAIDWPRYFELIGKKEVGKTICNCAPPAVAVSGLLLADTPEDELEAYLRFHAVSAYAAYLPERFHQASFAFYGKHLSGQQEQRPRWKRALGWVQGALGEAVGELYVARHFKPEAKERALKLVESVRGALEERLRNLKWMTEATRDRALEKMGKFGFKIGARAPQPLLPPPLSLTSPPPRRRPAATPRSGTRAQDTPTSGSTTARWRCRVMTWYRAITARHH